MSSKFLIIGDLHGNMPKIYFKDFDYIIAPGDFCSDALRKYMFQALQQKLNDSKSKVNWYDLVGKKRAKKMVDKSLKDGRKILEFLNSFNKPIILVPGNWDWTEDGDSSWSYLRKDHYSKFAELLQERQKLMGENTVRTQRQQYIEEQNKQRITSKVNPGDARDIQYQF